MITPILLFAAFLLLLLTTLSVPIIKPIYLFQLVAQVNIILDSSIHGSANFGVWGYCISPVDVAVLGFNHDTAARCSKAHLGYTFDDTVATALHVNLFEDIISRTLTVVLVLHPIACILTFLALTASLFTLRRGASGKNRIPTFVALVVGIIAASMTTLAFLMDIILVAIVRQRVHNDTNGVLTLNWGNAVWMSLGATLAVWGAMVGAGIAICRCPRWRNRNAY